MPGCRCLRRTRDRKSTRLNSSHVEISYAVFCLKKKKTPKYSIKHRDQRVAEMLTQVVASDMYRFVAASVCNCLLNYYFCYHLFDIFFFFNDTAPTEIYTLSLHDALPISCRHLPVPLLPAAGARLPVVRDRHVRNERQPGRGRGSGCSAGQGWRDAGKPGHPER